MRTQAKWVDKIQDSEKVEQCIYQLCFNPDGSQLIVASGHRVLVYETAEGTLIAPLKGHKDNVYCVSYASDGKKFASGSADKTVIIWTSKLEGILKYSHSEAVQCLAYNPLSHQLASCSLTDFAFWSAEQKAVQKHKVLSRINTCSWTNDGLYLALGLGNGSISIRNKIRINPEKHEEILRWLLDILKYHTVEPCLVTSSHEEQNQLLTIFHLRGDKEMLGEEKGRIERAQASPSDVAPSIWAIAWNPSKDEPNDILCVTDWSQNLCFYTMGGKMVGKERNLGFEALTVSFFPRGDFILIGGTNKMLCLYTKEGLKLGNIGETQSSWIWCAAPHPSSNYVVVGCQDGTIAYYQLTFNTVHGLFKERYAYRENMTDVIIQHLLTDQKVKIKCRDLVKKIAIYKHRLAVQLPERIVIYELFSGDADDMHYRVKEKIAQRVDCSLLVVCSKHLVVCFERRLQCLNFNGDKEREWILEAPTRYIKVVGGPSGSELLLLGLKNGQIWKIYLDNSFPLKLLTIPAAIRCLDLSAERKKIAVVDDNGICQVFKVDNGDLVFKEPNVNSVAWNSGYEDMLGYSGNNTLTIKLGDFTAHRQKMVGFIVGLIGSKVFCLNGQAMTCIDIPLSTPMYQFLEKKAFKEAFEVASLGVTTGDWEELAGLALESLELDIARQAYVRLQNFNCLEFTDDLLDRQSKGEPREVLIGDIMAYRGRFKDAGRMYQRTGQDARALSMYTDLRMFDQAQDFLGSGDQKGLIRQKAEWAKNINESKAACDLYLSIGEKEAAIEIMAEQKWIDELVELGRKLEKSDRSALLSVAEHLRQMQQTNAAAEIYRRIGDSASVLSLHVDAREWPQAFAMAEQNPHLKSMVYIPYAHWLAENDNFVQAQKAFYKAGQPQEAFKVLQQLTENAVDECRYQDASYYYWVLSRQYLDLSLSSEWQREEMLKNFRESEKLANIYYTYHIIHRYLEEPFTSFMPETLFNISRFVLNEIGKNKPRGISLFGILYSLSKQARTLGANKLAKQLYDRILTLRIPSRFQEQVEVSSLGVRAKPFSDPEELLPMCYRCSTYNPLVGESNKCVNCGQAFAHSFASFEILPLVEFVLEDGITDIEAVRLIDTPVPTLRKERGEGDGWVQEVNETSETLQLSQDVGHLNDVFTAKLITFEKGGGDFVPVTVSKNNLLAMDASTILIAKWKPPLRYRYYRNVLPELQITMCTVCFKAFYVDDFELQVLQKGHCPFCRTPMENSTTPDSTDDLLNMM